MLLLLVVGVFSLEKKYFKENERAVGDWNFIGTITPRTSQEINGSNWSIGKLINSHFNF